MEKNASDLGTIHRRRFADSDEERFMLLWCEIEEILDVSVQGLGEEWELRSCLNTKSDRWWRASRQDELEYLILAESRGRPPPSRELKTIADVLDYLLG